MSVDLSADSSLDTILSEVGEFGVFQVVTFLLICIPCALQPIYAVGYIFTANTLDYRCKVPECDVGGDDREIKYDQPWLHNAIPTSGGKLKNCMRFAPIIISDGFASGRNECTTDLFNTSVEIECSEFVYASDEKNVQTEFKMHCSESYKLALVGTVNNIGRIVFLPVAGFMADKFGRLMITIIGAICGTVFGLIKSFSTSYSMFLVCEFLESFGASALVGIWILALECVTSKYRVFGNALVTSSFSLGEVVLGVVAMYFHDFRHILRIMYAPGLLLLAYFWLVPESVRWLLVNGQVDRAIKILKRIAHVNGKHLSKKSVEMIQLKYSNEFRKNDSSEEESNQSTAQLLYSILKSKTLCLRLLNCCYQWINCCFCYYGLSLIVTHIPGEDRYTSFIYSAFMEIPGLLLSLLLLNKLKRRVSLFIALFMTAISTAATVWVPEENSTIMLTLFMLAKIAITCTFISMYIYTAEQWPTNLRTTIICACSMIGRFGSMVAPLIGILASQYGSLPVLLFGGSAVIAAILILFLPETFLKKLPDSIEEAKRLK